jgi:hypothetical protein
VRQYDVEDGGTGDSLDSGGLEEIDDDCVEEDRQKMV